MLLTCVGGPLAGQQQSVSINDIQHGRIIAVPEQVPMAALRMDGPDTAASMKSHNYMVMVFMVHWPDRVQGAAPVAVLAYGGDYTNPITQLITGYTEHQRSCRARGGAE